MEAENATKNEIHTGLPDCHCLACCQEGADCPIHGHVNRKLAAGGFAWQKELAARVDGEACNICGVQAATLEAGGYRCKEHQHWTAARVRSDVEQLLREVLGYLDGRYAVVCGTGACGSNAELPRVRDLKQRVEAVVGRRMPSHCAQVLLQHNAERGDVVYLKPAKARRCVHGSTLGAQCELPALPDSNFCSIRQHRDKP